LIGVPVPPSVGRPLRFWTAGQSAGPDLACRRFTGPVLVCASHPG
jgi:hypothetical protein